MSTAITAVRPPRSRARLTLSVVVTVLLALLVGVISPFGAASTAHAAETNAPYWDQKTADFSGQNANPADHTAWVNTYNTVISEIRTRVTNGDLTYSVGNERQNNDFFRLRIIGDYGATTLVVNAANLYVIGYLNERTGVYFSMGGSTDDPTNASNPLNPLGVAPDMIDNTTVAQGDYGYLERLAGESRGNQRFGPNQLNDYTRILSAVPGTAYASAGNQAWAIMGLIQMFAEGARFDFISANIGTQVNNGGLQANQPLPIQGSGASQPDSTTQDATAMDFENNWSSLSNYVRQVINSVTPPRVQYYINTSLVLLTLDAIRQQLAVAYNPKGGGLLQVDPAVVAADGSGTFTTVQAAIDSIPADGEAHTITIRPGTYHEVINVPAKLTNLTIQGSTGNPEDVVITYGNAHGMLKPDGTPYGTTGSATATFRSSDLAVTGVTIVNSFDPNANPQIDQYSTQAVAVAALGDRQVYNNDRFIGTQDTVETVNNTTGVQNRQYFRNDFIAGTVDFLFGNATAVFDQDNLEEIDRGQALGGNVVAPNTDSSQKYGMLITNSNLFSSAAPNTFTLGRPWHNTPTAVGQLVVRDTTLPAGLITAAPWTDMTPDFHWWQARFAEYQNGGAGAGVNSNRPQLADAQAGDYTAANYLAGSDGWSPVW
ncbi:pectinesterase family protein [Kitasatospora viridis]|uniref:Pectin methylesterase-like acyl-CoA thioesterase n=1 Tax=Kitasatospora viridis TaxID=281105 RepID=A0A561TWI1_9ACTN|nr:pectinesterase family protein [Kitasatospora viridis]TWF91470.1 pectin methylesterase-like acyl-CoA thioesterase [Kitasatospora viridis]